MKHAPSIRTISWLMLCIAALFVIAHPTSIAAQEGDGTIVEGALNPGATVGGAFVRYHDRADALLASPGAFRSGLLGYANPAMAATTGEFDAMLNWAPRRDNEELESVGRIGFFSAFPGIAFGTRSVSADELRINDYRISAAVDFDAIKLGAGYGWYAGDTGVLPGSSDLGRSLSAGALFRPTDFASLGVFGTTDTAARNVEGVADLAVRPFGTELLTVFGEYAADSDRRIGDGRWSAGGVVEPLSGLRITGRYIKERGLEAGVHLSLGRVGASYRRHSDPFDERDAQRNFDQFEIRLGAYDRNIADTYFADETRYLELDIGANVLHRPRFMFDPAPTLYGITEAIRKAGSDPTVGGIVLDATDMRLSQPMAWEIGQALHKFRDREKHVVVYLERGGMDALHLLAAADRVVMDPEGTMNLSGFVSSSTYLSELLEGAGIGVVEFRQTDYKSSLEPLTRTDMSEEDREQRREFVDTHYESVRERTVATRPIATDEFDRIIDYGPPLLAEELVEAGLVDETGRYPEIGEVISSLEGSRVSRVRAEDLGENRLPDDDRWQARPRIGVVYATGTVSTDTGMRAREVASELRSMRRDPDIAGVVMRVNSPGGSILASNLIAEEVRALAEVKPMAVSMAGTAASGGYWISMHADRIFALPTTLTGSIGVIAGWMYDDGVSENLRVNEESVQRGESADLFVGPVLPLVNLGLWPREPDEREREEFLELSRKRYDRFVANVSEARNMVEADVLEIAGGRVWTGEAALERGLVDELGSLGDAVRYVREQAGIPADRRARMVKGPALPVFELPEPLPGMLAHRSGPHDVSEYALRAGSPTALLYDYLETAIDNSGRPMALLPFEYLHWYYREAR